MSSPFLRHLAKKLQIQARDLWLKIAELVKVAGKLA
jgi:hypothetical protein